MDDRFSRTRILVGDEGVDALRKARVAIFGVGGVGSFALEAIARAGVGYIVIADFDTFEASNINRQLLAVEKTLGREKAEVARERVLEINPEANVRIVSEFVSGENLDAILSGNNTTPESCDFEYAIDAIDSVSSKVELLYELYRRNISLISCMGAGSRLDYTALKVDDISKTEYCALAKAVRLRLRKLGVFEGIRCVFSGENLGNLSTSDPRATTVENRKRKRLAQGTISHMPGIIGLIAAGTIINDIVRSS